MFSQSAIPSSFVTSVFEERVSFKEMQRKTQVQFFEEKFQERMKDSVRLLGISLSNLNTEIKKTVVVQLRFEF